MVVPALSPPWAGSCHSLEGPTRRQMPHGVRGDLYPPGPASSSSAGSDLPWSSVVEKHLEQKPSHLPRGNFWGIFIVSPYSSLAFGKKTRCITSLEAPSKGRWVLLVVGALGHQVTLPRGSADRGHPGHRAEHVMMLQGCLQTGRTPNL